MFFFKMNRQKKSINLILIAYLLEKEEELAKVCMELTCQRKQKKRKPRKTWVKKWVAKREHEGFCEKLLRELRDEEPTLYRNFLRMSHEQFENLCNLITPLVHKKDTRMRKSIPVNERLAVTIRFLATGDSFMSLQYLFRIPQSTISKIVPEVLDAIYRVLVNDYLKASILTDITLQFPKIN